MCRIEVFRVGVWAGQPWQPRGQGQALPGGWQLGTGTALGGRRELLLSQMRGRRGAVAAGSSSLCQGGCSPHSLGAGIRSQGYCDVLMKADSSWTQQPRKPLQIVSASSVPGRPWQPVGSWVCPGNAAAAAAGLPHRERLSTGRFGYLGRGLFAFREV